MRVGSKIPEREVRRVPDVHTRTVAISPRLRGMSLNLDSKLKLSRTAQGFTQNFRLVAQLSFVSDVLILASTTPAEIRAFKDDTLRCRREYLVQPGAREAGAALQQAGLNSLARQNVWQEDRFPATVCVCGKPGKPIAAINE